MFVNFKYGLAISLVLNYAPDISDDIPPRLKPHISPMRSGVNPRTYLGIKLEIEIDVGTWFPAREIGIWVLNICS